MEWTPLVFFNYIVYVLISLLFAFLAAKLVKYYAPSAAGSGISEIKCIISGFVMDGFLGWPTLFIKSLGLPLAIAAGLSVGKEGPSVHYAVCVGNSIAKLITKYKKKCTERKRIPNSNICCRCGSCIWVTNGRSLIFYRGNVFGIST